MDGVSLSLHSRLTALLDLNDYDGGPLYEPDGDVESRPCLRPTGPASWRGSRGGHGVSELKLSA